MDDKRLLKLRKSPEILLQELMDEYLGFVYSLVYKKLSTVATKEDVEEVVGDVFIKLYKSLASYDPKKCSIKTFIGVIAKNTATDKYRQLSKSIFVSVDCESLPEEKDSDTDIEKSYIKKEEQDAIFNAVFKLREPNRTIIFRRFYLDESISEIASKTGYSVNAVQKRLKRTLKQLKTILEGDFYGKEN